MGFLNQRRKSSKMQRLHWLIFYRRWQLASSRVGLVIGLLVLGYGLFFDRAGFFSSWYPPLVTFFLIFLCLWGIRHYK